MVAYLNFLATYNNGGATPNMTDARKPLIFKAFWRFKLMIPPNFRDQEAASSSLATPTIQSVLTGSENPVRTLFYLRSWDHDSGSVCIRAKKCCASPVLKYAYHASSVSGRKTPRCSRTCFVHNNAPVPPAVIRFPSETEGLST